MGIETPVSAGRNRSIEGNRIFGASDDLFRYEPISRFEPKKFGAQLGLSRASQWELERLFQQAGTDL